MEFDLKGALKKYHRMRSWRHAALFILVMGGVYVPWLVHLSRTDSLICWVGALVVGLIGHIEMRLKTIQVRLAGMDDTLDALSGREAEGNLILELNDW